MRLFLTFILLACLSAACTTRAAPVPGTEAMQPAATASPSPAPADTLPPPPTPTETVLTSVRQPPLTLPDGLTLEEYPLTGFPDTEGREFTPVSGSQEAILALRAGQRDLPDPALAQLDPNDTNQLRAELDGSTLYARLDDTNLNVGGIVYPQSTLRILRDKDEIYIMDLGFGGPVPLLRGLWTFDGHWVVEAARADPGGDMPTGQIIMDGELLNEKFGYEEAFEFQTLAGRPFYFFKRDGKIGAVYEGQEIPLDYDVLQHYYCCSGGAFNPIPNQNMVSFFAMRAGTWYYVELGRYE